MGYIVGFSLSKNAVAIPFRGKLMISIVWDAKSILLIDLFLGLNNSEEQ